MSGKKAQSKTNARPSAGAVAALSYSALDQLMPMHLMIGSDGQILHVGPTLQKLMPTRGLAGEPFFETFELRRPRLAKTVDELCNPDGVRLKLRLRGCTDLRLKGLALPLPQGAGVFANLSFGISVPDAIRSHALSAGDFAHPELVIEMLYLIEAKDALTAESHNLKARLLDAKGAADARAKTDALTGLKNRRAMEDILRSYKRTGRPFSLMNLDLDHFKAVNDTLGHAAGDVVLCEVARILTEETRVCDSIIRLGGDEFTLILDNLTDTKPLKGVAQRILKRLAIPIPYEGQHCKIAGSVGVTISTDYEQFDAGRMQHDADMALYAAKKGGRAQMRFARDLDAADLENGPPQAIDRAS
jgi:diguanylate cyclase (GGDEF)-like protein